MSQPGNVSALIDAALAAGATSMKPAAKSLWGFGGVVQAPDGTIWKVATSTKKDTGPATRDIDEFVLLLGVADVAASKRFYVDHGLTVARSFGRKYAEFDSRRVPSSSGSTGAAHSPRTPVSPRTAAARTGCHQRRRRALHRPGRVRVEYAPAATAGSALSAKLP